MHQPRTKTTCYTTTKVISSILVPLMIGILTIAGSLVQLYIANQQREQDIFLANQTRTKDLEIVEQNHLQALFLASEQQKDTILNDYLNFIAEFIEKNYPLSSNKSEAKAVIEFKTFAVLDQLDGKRKAHVVRALYNTGLIRTSANTGSHTLDYFLVALNYANLSEAELGPSSQEYLRRRLTNIQLSSAVLTNASFRHLCIDGANFDLAQLEYADFTNTAADQDLCFFSKQTINFARTRLIGACFNQAKFEQGSFAQAVMDDAVLRHFQCYKCQFHEVKARRADFTSSILTGNARGFFTDLSDSLFYNASISTTRLSETTLDRANATEVSFHHCRFYKASLIDVILTQSTIENSSFILTNLTNSFFKNAKLTQTSFYECSGVNVTFADALIENCIFTNKTTINGDFTNAIVKNTDFFGSTITYADQLVHAQILINVRLSNGTTINKT